MKPRYHLWTEAERETIRIRYDHTGESVDGLARTLGVTVGAIRGQIDLMGLGRGKSRSKPWTPDEDEKLAELITRFSPKTVSKKMRRSVGSIVQRCSRKKLSLRGRYGWYTVVDAAEVLGVSRSWVQARINTGILKAVPHYDNGQPAPGTGGLWHIDEKDLAAFIRKYPQELKGRNVDLIAVVDLLVGLE